MTRSILAALLVATAPAAADPIVGGVTYLERLALPPESVLAVRLVDAARQDTAAVVLAETRRLTLGGPPFAFALEVDPLLLGERRRQLRLEATIETAGRVRMRTTDAYVLAPASFAEPVTLTVRTIGASADGAAPPFTCAAPDGSWTFALDGGTAIVTAPGPSVAESVGTVARPTDDLVVWQGGPPLGAASTAVLRAEACGDGFPWSVVLVQGTWVRQGCCEAGR